MRVKASTRPLIGYWLSQNPLKEADTRKLILFCYYYYFFIIG
jgi:hypothetical protein